MLLACQVWSDHDHEYPACVFPSLDLELLHEVSGSAGACPHFSQIHTSFADGLPAHGLADDLS